MMDDYDYNEEPFSPVSKGELFAFALVAGLVAFIIGAGLWEFFQ
jgi:hypothetical protein